MSLLSLPFFMLVRRFLTNKTLLKIGGSTLTIYIVHFIILYGSFTGLGLYKFFYHELTPWIAISGALTFMVICTYLSLIYNKRKIQIKEAIEHTKENIILSLNKAFVVSKLVGQKLKSFLIRFFASIKN